MKAPSPTVMDVDPQMTTKGDAFMADAENQATPDEGPSTTMDDDGALDSSTPMKEVSTSDNESDMEKDPRNDNDGHTPSKPSTVLLKALMHKNAGKVHFVMIQRPVQLNGEDYLKSMPALWTRPIGVQ